MVMTRSAAVAKKQSRSALGIALPREIVVDIVGILAASSPQPMADLCSLRSTCKDLYGVSKERHVGRRLAVEKEKKMKWRERDNIGYLAMLEHLANAGNPEACFILGLTLFFARHHKQEGLLRLEQAAAGGDKTAAYVLGLLLCKDGRDLENRYISQVEGDDKVSTEKTNQECMKYRQLAAKAVREVAWKGMTDGGQSGLLLPEDDGDRCTNARCGVPEPRGWADYDVFCSDDCRIRRECVEFFGMVSRYLSAVGKLDNNFMINS